MKKQPKTKTRSSKTTKELVNDSMNDTWQSMYAVTEHWQSDLKFFFDEVSFFRILIDKYFIWLVEKKNVTVARELISELTTFEKKRIELEYEVAAHLSYLSNLILEPFTQNRQKASGEHATLEQAVAEYVKGFRALKNKVFSFTKKMIDLEKVHHLLTP